MQVSGKTLLNSAESILRDRRQNPQSDRTGSDEQLEVRGAGRGELFSQGVLESRILKLQASLSKLQNEYSREQARQAYLKDGSNLAELHYNSEPLFPELETGMDRSAITTKVETSLFRLIRELKSMQVEMENLYALNYSALPDANFSAEDLAKNSGMKPLDPERVARLTRP